MIKHSFEPVYDENSEVLILGSFPSVKSREVCFYYGNPRNRFWNMLCSYFCEECPKTNADKREFLLRRKIALWDVVSECEIKGSLDSEIKNFKVADIQSFLQNTKIRYIILNGSKAYTLFKRYFPKVSDYCEVEGLPSTSPLNFRFNIEEWHDALSRAFNRSEKQSR